MSEANKELVGWLTKAVDGGEITWAVAILRPAAAIISLSLFNDQPSDYYGSFHTPARVLLQAAVGVFSLALAIKLAKGLLKFSSRVLAFTSLPSALKALSDEEREIALNLVRDQGVATAVFNIDRSLQESPTANAYFENQISRGKTESELDRDRLNQKLPFASGKFLELMLKVYELFGLDIRQRYMTLMRLASDAAGGEDPKRHLVRRFIAFRAWVPLNGQNDGMFAEPVRRYLSAQMNALDSFQSDSDVLKQFRAASAQGVSLDGDTNADSTETPGPNGTTSLRSNSIGEPVKANV